MSSYNNKKNYLIVFALIMLLCAQNSKKNKGIFTFSD